MLRLQACALSVEGLESCVLFISLLRGARVVFGFSLPTWYQLSVHSPHFWQLRNSANSSLLKKKNKPSPCPF